MKSIKHIWITIREQLETDDKVYVADARIILLILADLFNFGVSSWFYDDDTYKLFSF